MNKINRVLSDFKGFNWNGTLGFALSTFKPFHNVSLYIFHTKIENLFVGQLFIVNGADIYFRQEVVITLWCPMRFDYYPLDKQVNIIASRMSHN